VIVGVSGRAGVADAMLEGRKEGEEGDTAATCGDASSSESESSWKTCTLGTVDAVSSASQSSKSSPVAEGVAALKKGEGFEEVVCDVSGIKTPSDKDMGVKGGNDVTGVRTVLKGKELGLAVGFV